MKKDNFGLRNGAARAALSGLLASPMSIAELRRLATDSDIGWAYEVRRLLVQLVMDEADAPTESTGYAYAAARHESEEELVSMIHGYVRTKRIGKNRLYRYMKEIRPDLHWPPGSLDITALELIRRFAERVLDIDLHALYSRVAGGIVEDPYLKGITRRP